MACVGHPLLCSSNKLQLRIWCVALIDARSLAKTLAALNFFPFDTTQQTTDVVTRASFFHFLAEHFDTGASRFGRLVRQANNFDFFANLDDQAALDTSRCNRSTAFDREHVFDRHQEWLVVFANVGSGIVLVQRSPSTQPMQALAFFWVSRSVVSRQERNRESQGTSSPGNSYLLNSSRSFQLNQFQQLVVIDQVAFIEEHDDVRNTSTCRASNTCSFGLRHGAVCSGNHQDSAVHLSSTGDHVFHKVSVARAVDVGIVTIV